MHKTFFLIYNVNVRNVRQRFKKEIVVEMFIDFFQKKFFMSLPVLPRVSKSMIIAI